MNLLNYFSNQSITITSTTLLLILGLYTQDWRTNLFADYKQHPLKNNKSSVAGKIANAQ